MLLETRKKLFASLPDMKEFKSIWFTLWWNKWQNTESNTLFIFLHSIPGIKIGREIFYTPYEGLVSKWSLFHKILHTKECTLPVYKMNMDHWRFLYLTNIYLIPTSTWPDLLGSTKVTKAYYGINKFYSICCSIPRLDASSVVYKSRAHIPMWMPFSFFWFPFRNSGSVHTSALTPLTFVTSYSYQLTVLAGQ